MGCTKMGSSLSARQPAVSGVGTGRGAGHRSAR